MIVTDLIFNDESPNGDINNNQISIREFHFIVEGELYAFMYVYKYLLKSQVSIIAWPQAKSEDEC